MSLQTEQLLEAMKAFVAESEVPHAVIDYPIHKVCPVCRQYVSKHAVERDAVVLQPSEDGKWELIHKDCLKQALLDSYREVVIDV